ncbi:MAG: PRC-barrel domain-containing protein [Tabrizicola sp.]|uniref:PRC-barrel domain-containing protein n=1 Tax=Tabrizicola sp. TaxID=2005166 RepID=UPI002736A6C1|nr:PRC-barrel domain-containing protein [Tabrizicola sp.]MDP3264680.1 PRC-barrel domain-containing protein [Tabrizicola sp.]MDP3649875.1 PRC-barrel domain-containing protein [Paracoccaceae bacterium]MDZ4066632.1 PRC-barrel domain-containing protein [Tabrizicola sp.]
MKSLLLGTAVALVLGASASAQDLFRTEIDPAAITASDFIGKRVYAAEAQVDAEEIEGVQQDWNDIGEINDVILTRDGRVDSVLIDIGGFLGIGERQVALSMESIRFVSDSATPDDMNDFFLVINADRTVLEGAPEYVRTDAAATEATDSTTGDATDATATDAAEGADDMAAEGADAAATDGSTTAATEGATDDTAAATNDVTAAETEGAANPGTEMDASSLTADQLMGVRVYGQNDEDVGEISDIVLDANGKATQVIVDVGGFLGIGEKPVALDLSQMRIVQETEGGALRAYVQMTEDELEGLPQQ